MLVVGSKLNPATRREVLGRYIYRWTSDNTRRAAVYGTCPVCGVPGGAPSEDRIECRQYHPTIPLQTDDEWLADHAFYVTKQGKLSAKHKHCEPAFMAD